MMKKIPAGIIQPSAAYAVKKCQIKRYESRDRVPEVGDVVYGEVVRLGRQSAMENRSGRMHFIHAGTKAIFVFGNRYAPDYYEGIVPDHPVTQVDMLAQSGVVGIVKQKNSVMADPTRVRLLGYVCSDDGKVLNTRDWPLIVPKRKERGPGERSKLVLVVGTSMNSGKSVSATACCWALSTKGYTVRASKVTGTATLTDILRMNDAGASIYNDFTHLGFPSTYMLSTEELLHIFNQIDLRYCNNPKNYWVVEIADGILQRETAILLSSEEVKSRIHRLVFCASDALGCIGALRILKERFGLTPDAISGICSSSPLARRELSEFSNGTPVFNNLERDAHQISEILI